MLKMNTYKAKILTVTKDCRLLVDVDFPFGINAKKTVSFTGVEIPATEANQQWLIANLKFKGAKITLKDEGYGNWSAEVIIANNNIKDSILRENIGKLILEEEPDGNR